MKVFDNPSKIDDRCSTSSLAADETEDERRKEKPSEVRVSLKMDRHSTLWISHLHVEGVLHVEDRYVLTVCYLRHPLPGLRHNRDDVTLMNVGYTTTTHRGNDRRSLVRSAVAFPSSWMMRVERETE